MQIKGLKINFQGSVLGNFKVLKAFKVPTITFRFSRFSRFAGNPGLKLKNYKKIWGAMEKVGGEVYILKLENIKKNVLTFSFYILLLKL